MILTIMCFNESETLCDSLKVSISLNKSFRFVSLAYRPQYKQQRNLKFVSAVLQNSKTKIVQQGKNCILNDYIVQTTNAFYKKI